MHFNGRNRETRCAKTGKVIMTNWPAEYDGRILSEEEYLEAVEPPPAKKDLGYGKAI